MIVLDEELQGLGLERAISSWYRGTVLLIKALRPGTVIKDEAIPALLRQVRQPTFVTINHTEPKMSGWVRSLWLVSEVFSITKSEKV